MKLMHTLHHLSFFTPGPGLANTASLARGVFAFPLHWTSYWEDWEGPAKQIGLDILLQSESIAAEINMFNQTWDS